MKFLPDNIEPDKYLGKGIEFLRFAVVLILIVLGLSLYAIFKETLTLGDLGAYLSGALGPIMALLVAFFTFLAFYVQYDANKKIQAQFRVQQFESQFYKMLDFHKSNVEDMKIPFYDTINQEKQLWLKIANKKDPPPQSFYREVSGKSCFVDMVKELEYCLENVSKTKEYLKYKLPAQHFFHFAYKIFFFGVHSEEVKRELKFEGSAKFTSELRNYLKDIQDDFREAEEPFYKRNVKIRYIPFQGHESRLGHYFRHLYQTVKYVVSKEQEKIITHDEARQYLRILRAQLSNAEQEMLYYNYICGFGANWDKLGDRGFQFLTKYRMIHNIPLSRVKAVENPRNHFKDFICGYCTVEDPLFEWGDNREELCNVDN